VFYDYFVGYTNFLVKKHIYKNMNRKRKKPVAFWLSENELSLVKTPLIQVKGPLVKLILGE